MIIFPFEHVFNRSSTWKVTVLTSSVTLKWSPECYKINLGGLVTSVYLFHVRILTPVSRKTERWRIPAGYPQFRGRLNIVSGFLMFVTFDSGLTLKKGCGYACNFVHDSRETPFTLVMIMLYIVPVLLVFVTFWYWTYQEERQMYLGTQLRVCD